MLETLLTPNITIIGITLTLLGSVIIYLVVLPYIRVLSYKRPDSEVYFFPIIGHFKDMLQDFSKKDDIKANAKSFKENFPKHRFRVTNLGTRPLLLLRDPQLIKDFALKTLYYHKHELGDVVKAALGNGLVFSEGATWKRHRKIVSGSFNYELLKENVGMIQDTTNEFLNKIPDMKNFSILLKSQEITGEVVGRLFFGEKLNSYIVEGRPLTLEFANLLNELGILVRTPLSVIFKGKLLDLPFPKYQRLKQRLQCFRSICLKIVTDRKAQPELGSDLLGRLIATQILEDPELRLSDEDIVDEFATFFTAGMDTSAHLVGMLFYILAQHPQHLKSLMEERVSIYNQSEGKTADMLQKMDVLHAMCKETLRLYSPFPFIGMRRCVEEHTLGDLTIKRGDCVEADLFGTFYDESIFENPREFKPERWLDPNFKHDPYAFVPFSAGPRNCIGQHLAIIEAKVIVSELLNRFDFKMKDGYKLKMTKRLVYEPEEDILLELTPKTSS